VTFSGETEMTFVCCMHQVMDLKTAAFNSSCCRSCLIMCLHCCSDVIIILMAYFYLITDTVDQHGNACLGVLYSHC